MGRLCVMALLVLLIAGPSAQAQPAWSGLPEDAARAELVAARLRVVELLDQLVTLSGELSRCRTTLEPLAAAENARFLERQRTELATWLASEGLQADWATRTVQPAPALETGGQP